jgi:hypothetical protein
VKLKAHLNGTQTCELCGGGVSAGTWRSTNDFTHNRYMKVHLKRCETASEEDRTYFREYGRWPKTRR